MAALAAKQNEVPVGAILVKEGTVIASAHNAPIGHTDPSAHAEILVLRQGAQILGNYRLTGCTLYATLEPCCMCAGAMIHARIERLVYAAFDQKTGCVTSRLTLLDQPFLNHRITHLGGIEEAASLALLQNFFQARR
ncbi:MAG TPA: tRNA adenosine(34) deaminase TadA, partial [Myxococcota bacterium]|nr:tRNA adenosine(34) deaminase TadA [Myxococcota bacterium]